MPLTAGFETQLWPTYLMIQGKEGLDNTDPVHSEPFCPSMLDSLFPSPILSLAQAFY
ncbi:MAG TPA: hypothetical protein VH593_18090 [Ktedonobacteraceae bacterium]